MRKGSIPIDFHKRSRGRYHSVLHRVDGVSVRLEGGSYNRIRGEVARVPHDIAHLIVEDALGLGGGLWGTLSAGGLVQNAILAAGRKPPHTAAGPGDHRSCRGESLRQAEILVRADALEEGSVLRLTWPR
jgi:hypothetical protein